MKIGEIFYKKGEIEINKGKEAKYITVVNMGDRPVQVGSHYHFFECNFALKFDRESVFGRHLDIPAGTAVESAFALLLTKVTKPPYPAKVS